MTLSSATFDSILARVNVVTITTTTTGLFEFASFFFNYFFLH